MLNYNLFFLEVGSLFITLIVLLIIALIITIMTALERTHRHKILILETLHLNGTMQREGLFIRLQSMDRTFSSANFTAAIKVLSKEGLIEVEPVNSFYSLSLKGYEYFRTFYD